LHCELELTESLFDLLWKPFSANTVARLPPRALSRSGKKILHVDKHDYYGGSEAAFSLQEAEEWVNRINQGKIGQTLGSCG